VGRSAGVPLEGMGVTVPPQCRHELTVRDVLGHNDDLIDAAIRVLSTKRAYDLRSSVEFSDGVARIAVSSSGITQLDVYLDGRPAGGPVAVRDGDTQIDVSAAADRSHYYHLYGFDDDGKLVAARRDRFGSGKAMPGRVQMSPVLITDPDDQ
jgi:hypothetical protein